MSIIPGDRVGSLCSGNRTGTDDIIVPVNAVVIEDEPVDLGLLVYTPEELKKNQESILIRRAEQAGQGIHVKKPT